MKKNKVTASNFLKWFFSDTDDIKTFGTLCVEMMEREGFVNISVRQLFDECGYIPGYICENKTKGDYKPSQVEFLDYPNGNISAGWHSTNT